MRQVLKIKARQSGEAFLFHVDTDLVLASRQLSEASDITHNALPLLPSLTLTSIADRTFADLSDSSYPCKETPDGSAIVHETLIVWTPVFGTDFCLAVVTPIDEIDAPIDAQLQEIEVRASALPMARLGHIHIHFLQQLMVQRISATVQVRFPLF